MFAVQLLLSSGNDDDDDASLDLARLAIGASRVVASVLLHVPYAHIYPIYIIYIVIYSYLAIVTLFAGCATTRCEPKVISLVAHRLRNQSTANCALR